MFNCFKNLNKKKYIVSLTSVKLSVDGLKTWHIAKLIFKSRIRLEYNTNDYYISSKNYNYC